MQEINKGRCYFSNLYFYPKLFFQVKMQEINLYVEMNNTCNLLSWFCEDIFGIYCEFERVTVMATEPA